MVIRLLKCQIILTIYLLVAEVIAIYWLRRRHASYLTQHLLIINILVWTMRWSTLRCDLNWMLLRHTHVPIHVGLNWVLLIKHEWSCLSVVLERLRRHVIGWVWWLVLHSIWLLGRCIQLELRVIRFHRYCSSWVPFHSVHHLSKVHCIVLIEFL